MSSALSPFIWKQSHHYRPRKVVAEDDVDICRAVDECIPSATVADISHAGGTRRRSLAPESSFVPYSGRDERLNFGKTEDENLVSGNLHITREQTRDAKNCIPEEGRAKSGKQKRKERRKRARTEKMRPDLKEFDRLNSTGEIDAVLCAAEREQIKSESTLRFFKERRSSRKKPSTSRNPVTISPPCESSGTDVSDGRLGKSLRFSRTGGGSGPVDFLFRKLSDDPDYQPESRVAVPEGRPTPRRSLRNAAYQRRSDANSEIDIIDLTGDDDIKVLRKEADALTIEEVKLIAPPHVFGDVLIEKGQIVPYTNLDPLEDQEEKLVTKLLRGTGSSRKISTIPSARITLRWNDFSLLRDVEWLNDEIMNAYMALINDRDVRYWAAVDEGIIDPVPGRPRSYCFSTFFYTRLAGGGTRPTYDYSGVARWTTRANVDIFKLDNVIVPINVGGTHWILVVLNIPDKEVYFLDSLHGRDKTKVVVTLQQWALDEIRDKHGPSEAEAFTNRKQWHVRRLEYRVRRYLSGESFKLSHRFRTVPRQEDRGSCGVFTAKMADCIALGIKAEFTSKHINLMRRRMALELYQRVIRG